MSILARKSPALLGIDISSTSIKVLELAKTGAHYRVESYAVEPLPPNSVIEKNITDAEQVGEAIGRAVKKSGTKTKLAACAVAGSAVITKIITMPSELTDEELEIQVHLEADQYISYPLDEINMDFEVMNPTADDPDRVDVMLAASRSDNVDLRVAALEIGGLTAEIVDVEAFALENSVGLIVRDSAEDYGHTIAVVDIGATVMTLSVLEDMHIIYAREQAFGGKQLTQEIQRRYGLSYEEASQATRQGGLPDSYELEVLEPFKESMAQEVNRAMQFFYSSSQNASVDSILLAGGCASIAGIELLVEERCGIKVIGANPFANMALSSRIKADALSNDSPAMMIACGLALRSFD